MNPLDEQTKSDRAYAVLLGALAKVLEQLGYDPSLAWLLADLVVFAAELEDDGR